MIKQLNLFLRFYDSLDELNYKKRWIFNNTVASKVICPIDSIIPFQVVRNGSPMSLSSFNLVNIHDDTIINILPLLEDGELVYSTVTGKKDYITYYGSKALKSDIPCGQYYIYLRSTFPLFELYSEIITVKNFRTFESFRVLANSKDYITFDNINIIKYK